MSSISKIGDIATGTCYAHKSPRSVTGVISTGDGTVVSDNIATACVGDTVVFNCGHTGVIVTGINNCTINNKAIAHIGSSVVGPMIATVVTGDALLTGN
jgi:uncharacterized Zn-binding protein involved in type VI secretion